MEKRNILSLSTKQTEELIRTDLSDSDLATIKDQVSTNLMKQNDLEEELKEISAGLKEKIKVIKKDNRQHLRHLRNGFIDERMEVHNIADDDRLVIEFYDGAGTKVGERKMTPEEKPTIQFNKSKTA